MGLGEVAGDREAEAGSALVATAGVVEADEALEDPLPIGLRYAGAVVLDLDDRLPVGRSDDDTDLVVGMAFGVVEQVVEDPGQAGFVA